MEHVTVRSCDIPIVGLGTWQLTGEDCLAAVPEALDLGYTHIDTAQDYGNEPQVGEALTGADRDGLFLTSKVSNDNHHPDDVVASVEQSLRDLGTDRLDLLLVHWPVEMDILPATLDAMRGLVNRDLVVHLGVSNFTAAQVRAAARHAPIVTNQVECHAHLQQRGMRALAAELDLFVTAYSPLGRGKVLQDPAVMEVAEAHGVDPAQVALSYLAGMDRMVVVPKATGRDHLASNLAALEVRLTDDDRAALAELDRGARIIDPPFAPEWDVD